MNTVQLAHLFQEIEVEVTAEGFGRNGVRPVIEEDGKNDVNFETMFLCTRQD